MKKFRIYFNAPITIMFVIICLMTIVLDNLTNGSSTQYIFSTYASSWLDPLTYVRLVCHIFGHSSISHLVSNSLYLLLLGPMLEEKYGSKIITVILTTALVTGICHNLLEPNIILLGSSGVVFAFILLASITGEKEGIPITLIFVAVLWLGQEVYSGVTTADGISQLSHIIGGLSGAVLGLSFKHNKSN